MMAPDDVQERTQEVFCLAMHFDWSNRAARVM